MSRLKPLLVLGPILLAPFLNYFFFNLLWGDFLPLLIWPLLIILIGIGFQFLFSHTLRNFNDLPSDFGVGISRILGLTFLFLPIWLLSNIGLSLYTQVGIIISLSLFFVSIFFFKKINQIESNFYKKPYFIENHSLFLWLYFGALVLISFRPEIYWAEKPMDFSILNFLIRNQDHPVQDPWAYGNEMRYYYFGYYIWAGISKLLSIPGEQAYHLSLATTFALMGGGLLSLFLWFFKRLWISIFAALSILFMSNIPSFFRWFHGEKLNSEYFWKSTRVFQNNFFAEFPSWSFLHADLHPHVMSYPFGISFIFLMIPFLNKEEISLSKNKSYLALISFSWSSLLLLNAWDFILYGIFFGLLILISSPDSKGLLNRFKLGSLIAITSLIFIWPYFQNLKSGKPIQLEWSGGFNNLGQIFSHQGHWWILLVLAFALIAINDKEEKNEKHISYKNSLIILFICIVFYFLAENIIFMDQVNTIFKTYTNIWVWMGLSYIFLWKKIFSLWEKSIHAKVLISLQSIFIIVMIFGSVLNFIAAKSYHPFNGKRPGLEGSAYLHNMDGGYAKIIDWINSNIEGAPLIVEAYGRSFDQNVARVSMHTGLPSYLGWISHVTLRGVREKEVAKRTQEIDYIYNSIDPLKVFEFLTKKGIKFVIIGSTEWERFKKSGLVKFEAYSKQFPLLVKGKGAALFGVGNIKEYLRKD